MENIKKINENILFFNKMAEKWDQIADDDFDLIRAILKLSSIEDEGKILDVGCGTGILENFFKGTNLKVTAIDISDKMIEKAESKFKEDNISFKNIDLFDFDEKDFDFIILYNIYPHFKDQRALASKLYNLLSDSGRLTIAHGHGKNYINKLHGKIESDSNSLKAVEEEIKYFSDFFKVDIKIDTDNCFMMSMTKKINLL